MKTALSEFIEWLKEESKEPEYFLKLTVEQIIDKATELLAKEKQDIIDAYCAGCKNSSLHKTHEEKATDYFTQKYEQQ